MCCASITETWYIFSECGDCDLRVTGDFADSHNKVCEKPLYNLHFPLIPAQLLLYDLWSCYLITLQILSWFISFRFLFLFFNHSNILWEIKKERKNNYKSNLMKWSLKIKIVKNCRVCKIAVSYCILHLHIFLSFWENIFGLHILTSFSFWLSSCHCFHLIFIFLNLNILLPIIISLTVSGYRTSLNCTTSLKMVFL